VSDPEHAERVEQALRSRRAELETELSRLTEPPSEGSISFGKRVGEGTSEAAERLSTMAMARSISVSIADIDRALEKIMAGSYGICDECGGEIAEARLEALPSTSRCITCAADH
jgi:DnaK suppressor protein